MNIEINCLNSAHGENWSAYNADCVDLASQMPTDCIDLSIYSPPFANLYIYSESSADMGNCEDDGKFFEQYRFLIGELLRMTKPGRISVVHCAELPNFRWKGEGGGFRDFSGEIVRAHVDAGWEWHCPRVTIWKDPVVEMQRTKALGLLHKQIKKDSTKSRMGCPDYLLIFKKPGENPEPVSHTPEQFPVDRWQQWASPVWMDVRQTNVLNRKGAKEDRDEKHICPLQLDVIERCVGLWSNPGDTVFSPFMGIGSEGYQSLKFGRKFFGSELKAAYFKQAVAYLKSAEAEAATLFDTSKV